jgi:hypothetical protein
VWCNLVQVVFKWRILSNFHCEEEAKDIAFYGAKITGRQVEGLGLYIERAAVLSRS